MTQDNRNSALSQPPEQQPRILIAEDNLMNQKVSLLLLKRLGYQADAVDNGVEALAALRQVPYNLVLMDCNMPEMDGFDATVAIRNGSANVIDPTVPIIALTADTMPEIRDTCIKLGMNDYLAKPIDAAALKTVLVHWLTEAQT
jgi:two-component system, sensor histidine kinase and response regulator